jgi:hypothetical protein
MAVRTGMINPPPGGLIIPFHPEVTWARENKMLLGAALIVF